MAKILNVISAVTPMGGTVAKLRSLMKTSRHQHFLYHPGYDSNRSEIENEILYYTSIGVPAYYGIYNRNVWKHAKAISRIIRKNEIDVVHFYFNFETSFAPLVKCWHPAVRIVRSIVGFDKELSFLRKSIVEFCFSAVPHFVFISEYIKCLYEQTFPLLKKKDSRIIYNGAVNVGPSSVSLKDRKILVTTSGLCERKNVIILIEAMNLICNHYYRKDIILYILGDGPEREKIASLIDIYKLQQQIVLVGYTNEVASYLGRCAIYLHPAITEGFGIAVTEAMEMYCPCIVADKGALPELVINGYNGFVIDAYDAHVWAAKILYLMDHEELRLQQAVNSHQRALEHFSLDAFVTAHDDMFDELVRPRLLVIHPTIAPYRIDFFNDLYKSFCTRICLKYWNLRDQNFDYQKIYERFVFHPVYLKELLRYGGRSFSLGYWKQLNDFLPDLVMTEEFSIGTIVVCLHRFLRRKKYRIVTLCDDSYNMVAEKNDFSLWHRFSRKMFAPCLDDIIVVAPDVEQWYCSHYGKGFFFPIIQDEKRVRIQYQQVFEHSKELRQKYGLSHKTIFLFVGRLVAIKNVKTILRSFASLNQCENVLIIVGDGPEKDTLRHFAKHLDLNAHFMGHLEGDALNVWYNLADVFVLASIQEAFGAVTNEALLAGCYVLVSNKAGSACLVAEGVNGYTFSPEDTEDLTNKMNILRSFPRKQESDGMRQNRMQIFYRDYMDRLVAHLKFLANG